MARSIAAAFLSDASWGDGPEGRVLPERPPVDWDALRRLVEANPRGALHIVIAPNGSLHVY
jgi:hypothetical protein